MARVRGQIASFKIFPEPGSSLHFRVRVFTDEDALRAYLRTTDPPRTFARYGQALCTVWNRVTASGALCVDCGELLLTRRWLNSEIVSHECSHAAIGWARRVGLRPFTDPQIDGDAAVLPDEERYCTAVGQLVRQLVAQLHARHLVV